MRAFLAVETGRPVGPGSGPLGGPAPAHLTLRFLGELPPEVIDRVIASVAPALGDLEAFDLALGGVGAFPSRERPRVVWLGVTEGDLAIRTVADRVRDALGTLPLPQADATFVPHVTLFRVRGARDRERAVALLEGRVPAPSAPPVRVTEVLLKESELTARGPVHRTVRAFPLSGGPGPV